MYSKISYDDINTSDLDGVEPTRLPIGEELQSAEMRSNVWVYDAGESISPHYHEQQDELYIPLSGCFEMEIEGETVTLDPGACVLVEPSTERQVKAIEGGRLLTVGAPPVEGDGVIVE